MNIAEYAENLFNLAYSQEMIDFITSLGGTSSDEWLMKVTAIRGYYFFVFYKSTSQFFIVGYMRRGNNTTDFVYINLNNAFILSQHLLSRFRKRVVANGIKYDLRPVIRYSDIVFCGTTFISVDMLNEKQKELWDSVHSKLLEHNLLRGNRK